MKVNHQALTAYVSDQDTADKAQNYIDGFEDGKNPKSYTSFEIIQSLVAALAGLKTVNFLTGCLNLLAMKLFQYRLS